MSKPIRRSLKNKTFRIPPSLEARLERRATENNCSVNQLVVDLLEQGLPRSNPLGRVRALGDRIASTRKPGAGPVPRFTKDELHEDR